MFADLYIEFCISSTQCGYWHTLFVVEIYAASYVIYQPCISALKKFQSMAKQFINNRQEM